MKHVSLAAISMAMLLTSCTSDDAIQRKQRDAGLIPPPSSNAPLPVSGTTKATLASGEIGNPSSPGSSTAIPPIIVKGSGSFSNPNAGTISSGTAGGGDITLNFVEADIKDVIKGVLGDILGATYAIDPNVNGKITI